MANTSKPIPSDLPPNLSRLLQQLVAHFDREELRTLCFDLGVRYDDLGGEGVSAQARELLLQLQRAKRLEALLARVEQLRPHVAWREEPPVEVACPYKGLHAFHEADAPHFFGREAFTEKLVAAVARQPLVAVVGPSGSGKSSVVFAGLVPALRVQDNWLIADFRPGSDPFLGLAGALLPLLEPDVEKVERPAKVRRLAANLASGDAPLADYLQMILAEQPQRRLLLICDQFEELYTQVSDGEQRRRFLDTWLAAVPDSGQTAALSPAKPLAVTFVLTLRADFMGQVLAYAPMVAALQERDVKIGPMSREELTRAIEQPAANAGVDFAPGLVTRILADVGDHAGNLPLLEFALTLLWERQSGGQMTHAAYEAIGGVAGALAQHAEETLARLTGDDPTLEQAIQRIMVQLVHPGAGAADTKRTARRADLGDTNWALVPRLADARLLVTGQAEAGADAEETAEIIHEALIQHWGRLQGWMEQDREFRMWQERLRADRAQWQNSEQQEGYLLQGAPLTVAAAWLEKRRDDLAAEEMAYIEASLGRQQAREAAEEARRQRELEQAQQLAAEQKRGRDRLRLIVGGLAAGLIIVVILAALLFNSNQTAQQHAALAEAATTVAVAAQQTSDVNAALAQTREADAETQAAAAATAQAREVERAEEAIWAQATAEMAHQEAERQARLAEARALASEANRLLSAGQVNRGLVNAYWAMRTTYDRDGIVITEADVASFDALTQIWAENTLEGHSGRVWSAVFNHDGTRILTASADGTARLWDGEGQFIKVLEGHSQAVRSAVFDHDGTRILTASADGTARLWDGEGQFIKVLEGHSQAVRSAVFNHDGTRILTASADGTARLWNGEGRLVAVLEGHSGGILMAVFNQDGTRILTAGTDDTARLWDGEGGFITALEGHSEWVTSAVFNHDGTRILTASADSTARLWDGDGGFITALEGHSRRVNSAVFNHDSTHILTASIDGTARLWNGDGRFIMAMEDRNMWQVNSAVFNHNSTRILTAGNDVVARLWNGDGGFITALEAPSGNINSAVFNHDSTRILTAGVDGTARLWDREGRFIMALAGHNNIVNSAVFNHDGTRILTASADGTVRLWRAYGGYEGMLAEAERKLRLVLSPEECLTYFAEFDLAFCEGWGE